MVKCFCYKLGVCVFTKSKKCLQHFPLFSLFRTFIGKEIFKCHDGSSVQPAEDFIPNFLRLSNISRGTSPPLSVGSSTHTLQTAKNIRKS